MATKRKHEDSDFQKAVHPSRQFQVQSTTPKPAKKVRRTEPYEFKKPAHAWSVNAIKKRIRDVTRRLERSEDLPANVKLEDERALVAYQQELAAAEAENMRQKMIKKYHMVRFFERQKATRTLKKLRKRLLEAKSTEDVEGLKSQMHIAEVDLNYTQYHPLAETYISLYPQKKDGEENSKADDTQTKPPIWAEVERCMEKGTLDRLRNRSIAPTPVPRKLVVRTAKAKKAPASVDTSGMNRRQRRKQSGISGVKEPSKTKHKSTGFERNQLFGASEGAKQTQDDGSDGGFFEE